MGCRNNILDLAKHRVNATGCMGCIRKSKCFAFELARTGAQNADYRILHPKPAHQGQHIINSGDSCDSIYIVRSGAFKSYFLDEDGEIQVLGFHLPGELFGVEGLVNGHHDHYVQALGTASVCRIPLAGFSLTPKREHELNLSLLRTLGQVISKDHKLIFLLSKMGAQRKFAFFLVDLVDRLRHCGFDQGQLTLGMSRADMANYLGLAVETVSRLFTRMQAAGLLEVNRRRLKINDMQALRAMANEAVAEQALLDKAS